MAKSASLVSHYRMPFPLVSSELRQSARGGDGKAPGPTPSIIATGAGITAASPRQGPQANSPGLDHNEIADQLVRMIGNQFRHGVGLARVRKSIQFQQDHPADAEPLANNQLAEIAIFGDQDATLGVCRLQNLSV